MGINSSSSTKEFEYKCLEGFQAVCGKPNNRDLKHVAEVVSENGGLIPKHDIATQQVALAAYMEGTKFHEPVAKLHENSTDETLNKWRFCTKCRNTIEELSLDCMEKLVIQHYVLYPTPCQREFLKWVKELPEKFDLGTEPAPVPLKNIREIDEEIRKSWVKGSIVEVTCNKQLKQDANLAWYVGTILGKKFDPLLNEDVLLVTYYTELEENIQKKVGRFEMERIRPAQKQIQNVLKFLHNPEWYLKQENHLDVGAEVQVFDPKSQSWFDGEIVENGISKHTIKGKSLPEYGLIATYTDEDDKEVNMDFSLSYNFRRLRPRRQKAFDGTWASEWYERRRMPSLDQPANEVDCTAGITIMMVTCIAVAFWCRRFLSRKSGGIIPQYE